MKPGEGNSDLLHLVHGTGGLASTACLRPRRWMRLNRLASLRLTMVACLGLLTIRCPAQSNPPVALTVVVGIPGTHLFAGLTPSGGPSPTNGNVVIIGASRYVSLRPETNAELNLVTSGNTNAVTMRVYSRELLYTLVAEDSTLTNGRNFAAITFVARGGKIYDVQLNGIEGVTLNYKLGIPPSFAQTPMSQAVAEGCTATFIAAASGLPAPAYQWSFNDADLPGETNATLMFARAQLSVKGQYHVRAINFLNSITSPAVELEVIPSAIRSVVLTPEGLFQFTAKGRPGQGYAVEASTNLLHWVSISTNPAAGDGLFTFTDSQTGRFPARAFRIATLCP